VRLPALLWIAVLANVASGIAFSPATSLRKARVIGAGADTAVRESIVRELSRLQGRPVARVDAWSAETRIQWVPQVDSAKLSLGPFGSGVLRVKLRRPVASIPGPGPSLLDGKGAIFRGGPSPDLARVRLPSEARKPTLALCGSANIRMAAKVAGAAQRLGLARGSSVELSPSGIVNLVTGSDVRVVLGGPVDIDQKLSKLRELLEGNPDLLGASREVNLSSPDRPMIVPRR
jgi:hypothetical protein